MLVRFFRVPRRSSDIQPCVDGRGGDGAVRWGVHVRRGQLLPNWQHLSGWCRMHGRFVLHRWRCFAPGVPCGDVRRHYRARDSCMLGPVCMWSWQLLPAWLHGCILQHVHDGLILHWRCRTRGTVPRGRVRLRARTHIRCVLGSLLLRRRRLLPCWLDGCDDVFAMSRGLVLPGRRWSGGAVPYRVCVCVRLASCGACISY